MSTERTARCLSELGSPGSSIGRPYRGNWLRFTEQVLGKFNAKYQDGNKGLKS